MAATAGPPPVSTEEASTAPAPPPCPAPGKSSPSSFYADEVNLIVDEKARQAEESYKQAVAEAREEDFADLDDLEFWEEEGRDNDGCQIIRIVGKFLPIKAVGPERLRRYIYRKMHERIAAEEDYSILYIHTRITGEENSPGLLWLTRLYESFPKVCKQRVKAVYALHPALGMRLALWAVGGWGWLSDGLYEKITFVSRVEFLWDYMRKSQVDIPDFVMEHDGELEKRPLMDYGFEVDPLVQEQQQLHAGVGPRVPF